jgi:hypothetical protein
MVVRKKKAGKRRPVKKGAGSQLPKAVRALLSYLGGPGPNAPTIQQTPSRFSQTADADKSFATNVAEAVVARQAQEKARRLVGAQPLRATPVSAILPQGQQPQTIILQQPQQPQPASLEKQTEEIKKEVSKTTKAFEARIQGLEQLKKAFEAPPKYIESLPSSQAPSSGSRNTPSIASFDFDTESIASSSASVAPAITTEALGQFLQQQHSQNLASATLPAGKKLRGKAPVATGGGEAQPKRRGRPPKTQAPTQQQTFSQSIGGLAQLASAAAPKARSVSSVATAGSGGSSRAREIYQQATSQGLSQGDIVRAMASGGGAAQAPQSVGITLAELPTNAKAKRKLKVVGKLPLPTAAEV